MQYWPSELPAYNMLTLYAGYIYFVCRPWCLWVFSIWWLCDDSCAMLMLCYVCRSYIFLL